MKKRIIFVCNGNIHRSVIAAESLKQALMSAGYGGDFLVDSYGLQGTGGTDSPKHKNLSDYPEEWSAAQPSLERFGIDISQHISKRISVDVVKNADVVVAMDEYVYSKANNSLSNQFPEHVYKIHRFSELSGNGEGVKDLAGNGSIEAHKKIITHIHNTLAKKYTVILGWVD